MKTTITEACIRTAESPQDIETIRALFREYADAIGIDLCFQGFEEELRALPGLHASPRGRLLLAMQGDEPVGCVALRPLIGKTQHGATPAPCSTSNRETAEAFASCSTASSGTDQAAATDICEMKRLYVRPSQRSTGLGRRLAVAIVEAGHELGYRRMCLDTLDSMAAARRLYESLGFREVTAYYDNPIPDVHYYEREL